VAFVAVNAEQAEDWNGASGQEFIEQRDRIAVGLTIASPEWPAPVKVFKVFAFDDSTDLVVRLTDCADESDARQRLAV